MRLKVLAAAVAAVLGSLSAQSTIAAPQFVNGVVIAGDTLDRTRLQGANQGRFGFFSDLSYDAERDEWWALSDRGPGGGLLDYSTRLQLLDIDLNKKTGAIEKVKIKETVKLTDPFGLLAAPDNPGVSEPRAMNGLNPLELNGSISLLGRSFDPEGLVVDPRFDTFIVSDEYGPSVYVFGRHGRLLKVFQTPENLRPRLADGATLDYVSDRTITAFGRQDNRGFEGLAISPDGSRLYAALQDPLVNEPGPNNGRDGRNVRIVAFDNNWWSPTYGKSIAQYVYQLEAQADVRARILAAGGTASATDPRQGRNIGLSAIVAINAHEFLVLERDNRGIGVDDPKGANVVGSKRVFKIDIRGATDVSKVTLPADALPTGIVPVSKSGVFIDLAANTLLPHGKLAEKWEGLAIGPRLKDDSRAIITGNDNDYSVTQTGAGTQYDVYVDFTGGTVQRDLDQPTRLDGVEIGAPPTGYSLLPGVLHSYRVPAVDLPRYVAPGLGDHGKGRDRD
ncbi:MAG: esterase-like activity of phytase family protein [Steroidobacteraceae bacterium]